MSEEIRIDKRISLLNTSLMSETPSHKTTLRATLHRQLDPRSWAKPGLSPINLMIIASIVAAVILTIAETEPTLRALPGFSLLITISDQIFALVFTAELIARFWSIGENPEFRGISGRLKYLIRPSTLIDIAALSPYYLTMGSDGNFMLRLFRFLRILTLAKLGRYSEAMHVQSQALHRRRYELLISLAFACVLLLISATFLFLLEGELQPDAFGSIPRALWWSVATLTTVGYGDVYPLTALGKVFGGLTALTGIGVIAMPTGIIAAAFSDAFQERLNKQPPPQ